MEIDLSGELVRLAYHFVGFNGKHPPYIRVEPHNDGAILVATDGASMFMGVDESGFVDEPLNLDLSVAVHMALKRSKPGLRVQALSPKKRLRVMQKTSVITEQPERWVAVDQHFPNWRHPVPISDDLHVHFPAVLAPCYLAQLGRLFDDTDKRANPMVFLGSNREFGGVMVYIPSMPHIAILVMPQNYRLGEAPPGWSYRFKQAAPEIDDDL